MSRAAFEHCSPRKAGLGGTGVALRFETILVDNTFGFYPGLFCPKNPGMSSERDYLYTPILFGWDWNPHYSIGRGLDS